MKNIKTLLMLSTLAFSFSAFSAELASVIDLKQEGSEFLGLTNKYVKSIKNGEQISFSFNDNMPHYVERLMISAIGQQSNYSFVKVYADGDEVATLGVPGRDPDYPIVIRGNVSNISLKAQDNSSVKILDFKIFTERKEYVRYVSMPQSSRGALKLSGWGAKVLELALEIEGIRRVDSKISISDMERFVLPMKKLAFKLQASSMARDSRSLETRTMALEMIKEISKATDFLESDNFMLDQRYDSVSLDLETIKQDISERYDIKN